MLGFIGTRKYGAIAAVLALTVLLSLVQLYYAASPMSPRDLYHHALRSKHRHNGPAPSEQLGWQTVLNRRRRRTHLKPDTATRAKTFLMLKTGGEVMWERLPVHFQTTLKVFPHFSIYSDDAAKIENYDVIDILQNIPSDVLENKQLSAYRVRQQSLRENWGWGNNDMVGRTGWENDKFKNIPMLLHAWKTAPPSCDWFLMIDDDTYVITESFAALVRDKDPRRPWYIGSSAMINDRLFAHGGSGLIISRGALDMAFGAATEFELEDIAANYSRNALNECCGDLMVGQMLRDLIRVDVNTGLSYEMQVADPFQGNAIADTELKEESWCMPLASYHHVRPWEIALLHEWEHKLGPHSLKGGATQSSIYIDLYLPFISADRQDWKIGARSFEFNNSTNPGEFLSDGDRKLSPITSKQDCIRSCELSAGCLGWEYEDGHRCILEHDRIRRGQALNHMSKEWKEGQGAVSSGWMIDRIRSMRAAKKCDPLRYDEETQSYNDDESTSEGWFFRLKHDDDEPLD